jgi:hypothetical protein
LIGTPPLIIDLNGDGTIDGSEVRITINGGGILDLGEHTDSYGGTWNPGITNGTWSNTGNLITEASTFTLYTLAEDFDENGPVSQAPLVVNEVTSIDIENRTNNEIGIDIQSLTSNGGIYKLLEDADNDDFYYGMTDYGSLWTAYDLAGIEEPETLTIEYPLEQLEAHVFVVNEIQDTTPSEVCDNLIDDDKDGLIDCDDRDCNGNPVCEVVETEVCTDGRDNDGDGLIDCADINDCAGQCIADLQQEVEDLKEQVNANTGLLKAISEKVRQLWDAVFGR